jgi:hypothetical protein
MPPCGRCPIGPFGASCADCFFPSQPDPHRCAVLQARFPSLGVVHLATTKEIRKDGGNRNTPTPAAMAASTSSRGHGSAKWRNRCHNRRRKLRAPRDVRQVKIWHAIESCAGQGAAAGYGGLHGLANAAFSLGREARRPPAGASPAVRRSSWPKRTALRSLGLDLGEGATG